MIRLYQFAPAFGLPNASPFCMKVETFLRMAGLSYECPRDADLRKAPKGKLPYIVDEGAVVSDSSFIVDHLKRKYGDPLDSHLGAADFLGDKPFFLGARPSSLDATAYAFLANILWVPLESPLKAHAQTYPQLAAYCARMREKYYGNQ